MVDDLTYLQTRFNAEVRGKLIDRLNTKLHKARTMLKVLRVAYGQLSEENDRLRKGLDPLRHEIATAKLQTERIVKEMKRLMDRNFELEAYYQATNTGDGNGVWIRIDDL